MKSLRKSLNGHKESHISSPLPPLSKPLNGVQPPKKVIRAIVSHRASSLQELSFEKGDFFHVSNDTADGQWYQAHNPATGARGLVPVHMFEEFSKGAATYVPSFFLRRSLDKLFSSPRTPALTHSVRSYTPSSPKPQAFYAIVLHDFIPERADELEAKAGDAITVVAQSNKEWFVAKPIGKLGRPGLIPVAFVEIRDPATGQAVHDVNALIEAGALPPVEDWKKQMMTYKANSISLGVLDESITPQTAQFPSSTRKLSPPQVPGIDVHPPTSHSYRQQQPSDEPSAPDALSEGILLSADVKSFHFEMEEYWFRVHAVFQPYGSDTLPPAKELVLFRSYNDFYDFQVSLLDAFPREAGRLNGPRILPYMPGPAPHVDNAITIQRRQELDEYLHELCRLRKQARQIIESRLIREFLALKPGDAGIDIDPQNNDIEALFHSKDQSVHPDREFSRMRLSHGPDSGYEESDNIARGYSSRNHGSQDYSSAEPGGRHYRNESSASMYHQPPTNGHPRSQSRSSSRTGSVAQTDSYEYARAGSSLEIDPYRANSYSRSSLASSHDPSPIRSSHAPSIATSASGRSRSQSIANNPPISASIPQTAFIKIKIFDKVSDDLVAIRVHPRVTHEQLLSKVQARLGDNVSCLRYRHSTSNALIELSDEEELRSWLDSTDRHVLWADSE